MKKLHFCALILAFIMMTVSVTFTVAATNDETEIMPGVVYQQGDVDSNGKVNVKDATAIQKYIAKMIELTSQQIHRADVDGLRGVNIKDATHLQKYLAKLEIYLFEPILHQAPQNPATDDSPIVLPVVPAP